MIDMLDRLRTQAKWLHHNRPDDWATENLLNAAAEEIERLRSAIDVARRALLRIEQGSESARIGIIEAMRRLITSHQLETKP